jgi:hypothetical protein
MKVQKFVGLVLIDLGAFAWFLALVFYVYPASIVNTITLTVYPYQGYSLPSAIIGTALSLVGLDFMFIKIER